jgi:HEPN domain-containing protein
LGIPQSRESRRFYRAAFQRIEEAEILLRAQKSTAAVYLAGYSVECILKALILEALPAGKRTERAKRFRGAAWHSLDRLKAEYVDLAGRNVPRVIAPDLSRVSVWTTDLRYSTEVLKQKEAVRFLASANTILKWAEGRL